MRKLALVLLTACGPAAATPADDAGADVSGDTSFGFGDGSVEAGVFTLATGVEPNVLAIAGDSVLIDEVNDIKRCSRAGCSDSPTLLVDSNALGAQIFGVAVDTTNAYFASAPPMRIGQCGLGGCGDKPAIIFSDAPDAATIFPSESVAVAGGFVHWVVGGRVVRCATSGCNQPSTLVTFASSGGGNITTDGTNLYWTDGATQVFSCPVAGCSQPTLLAVGQAGPVLITTDALNVYWTIGNNLQSIVACDVSGCNGVPTVIATSQPNPAGIVADGKNIYWTIPFDKPPPYPPSQHTGRVMKCSVYTCNDVPIVVADKQNEPSGIALDQASVYFGNVLDHTVIRVTPK